MKYSAVKGVRDILPPEVHTWQWAEAIAREVFKAYGFLEMRLPVMEHTEIFTRSIGETTDIVEKEMYTFPDRAGRSLTLRPEGTASAVRCYVENHLHQLSPPQKFYYWGPMFRYERPQKGRLRQFYQIGVEAFGVAEPSMDAEVISMLMSFLRKTGLDGLALEINSIGCSLCRPRFREALIGFFSARLQHLCIDCKRRYTQNPLRILDCKVETCIEQRKGAPFVSEFLCEDCKAHFGELLTELEAVKIPFTVAPSLVRGLDYYTRTIFEVKSPELGAQNAVAAGGRYDGLVEEFGGPPTPATGFALGMERFISLVKEQAAPTPAVFIAPLGKEAVPEALRMAEMMRDGGLPVELGHGASSLKSQMRKADRLHAEVIFILGSEELARGTVSYKNLKDGTSGEIARDEARSFYGKTI